MKNITSLIGGIIFGIGLVVSGMTDPAKVIGFLDITGDWDYSLALVMGGAVVFNFISFRLIRKRTHSIYDGPLRWPTRKDVDTKLLFGSGLFGVGWGIAGICPGPGIVNLIRMDIGVLIFVLSMVAGMLIYKLSLVSISKGE